MIEHKSDCASVTQLLLCDPPRPAHCDCGAEKLYTDSWSIPAASEPMGLKVYNPDPPPPSISFHSGNPEPVMRIERDRIWVDPEVEVTETAKLVLAAMEEMMQEMLRKEWNAAIDAAIESLGQLRVMREDGRWQQNVMRELKK